jgi:hypothetical protein
MTMQLAQTTPASRSYSSMRRSTATEPRREAAQTPACLLLQLQIESTDVWAIRKALRGALGTGHKIFVVSVDAKHHKTSIQIEATREEIGEVMGSIISTLPAAEFGVIRSRQ